MYLSPAEHSHETLSGKSTSIGMFYCLSTVNVHYVTLIGIYGIYNTRLETHQGLILQVLGTILRLFYQFAFFVVFDEMALFRYPTLIAVTITNELETNLIQ
jgi:uncharacterized protein YqjF (DUF2071 family)